MVVRALGISFLFALAAIGSPIGGIHDDEPGRVQPVTRPGDGSQVAGLGAEFHGRRRAVLRERLGEGLVLVRGLPTPRGYEPFRQDKTFWYLTGIESPNATLVMDAKTGEEFLFLPPANPMMETWEGELWDAGDAWVPALTGIANVEPANALLPFLERRARDATVWISTYPEVVMSGTAGRAQPHDDARRADPLDGRSSRADALKERLEQRFGATVRDFRQHVSEMRWVKEPEEIAAIERASESAARAIVAAIRATRAGMGEWEIDALLTYVQRLEGASGAAYAPIVGSGRNSCVLHYVASSRRMREDEVLLVDYAPEVDGYVSDVTRTWPVGAAFSREAARLYDIVLEAQTAGIAAVKPGATFAQVEAACDAVFRRHGVMALKLHGACHTVGLEVHDTNVPRRSFVPGVAFTIEPGLYDVRAGIGIRIEDVVLVTEDGHRVLSASAPKERSEIEALRRAALGDAAGVGSPR